MFKYEVLAEAYIDDLDGGTVARLILIEDLGEFKRIADIAEIKMTPGRYEKDAGRLADVVLRPVKEFDAEPLKFLNEVDFGKKKTDKSKAVAAILAVVSEKEKSAS